MLATFRVINYGGFHDATNLQEAKETSNENSTIQMVYGLEVLTQRKRKSANMSWVMNYISKHPEFCAYLTSPKSFSQMVVSGCSNCDEL